MGDPEGPARPVDAPAPPATLTPHAAAPADARWTDTVAALERGDAAEARRLAADAFGGGEGTAAAWRAQVRDVASWPDAWLIAATRRDPPDEAALDALVGRYWKPLVGRCELLALDRQRAGDLAQETWYRVLRARRALEPNGNFPGYLMTIATNLWRDWNRAARRAGPMADDRVASIDAALPADDGDTLILADVLPDLDALHADEQAALRMDVDRALERLGPRSRDVLTARFLGGESCAEIGRRYGRTEQTASAWVRQAVREMKLYLGESPRVQPPEPGR